jgi:oligopeptidase A
MLTNHNHNKSLPNFSTIELTKLSQTIERLINEIKSTINSLASEVSPTWDNLVSVIAEKENALDLVWNQIMHLNAVMSNPELRAAHDESISKISELTTWKGQHQKLYETFLLLKNDHSFSSLSKSQQKLIENKLEEFELSGIQLDENKKQRFADIEKRLTQLGSIFSNNVLDATSAYYKLITDESCLSGLPETSINAAENEAKKRGYTGWVFTLDMPSYLPVMTYADDRQLRKELNIAFDSRASDCGPQIGNFNNSDVIEETIKLRKEKATLLGVANYAELSLKQKMAEDTNQVFEFLNELAELSYPQAQQDIQDLTELASTVHGIEQLKPWDVNYYSEKLKQKSFAFSEDQLKSFFPQDKVLEGLFTIANKLFDIKVIEVKEGIDTWHGDVRFYNIFDNAGNYRGGIYFDLYARSNKRGGAWVSTCINRHRLDSNNVQFPVAFLSCNFSNPVNDMPALFTHKEVVTLFHEFGHALHHTLTKVDEKDVSGINGVLWDAVELPSQLLENWCWQEEALSLISGHYETGEPLPKSTLEKMLNAKNFQSARFLTRQLEFALFDFTIHAASVDKLNNIKDVQVIFDQVRSQVCVIPASTKNRFQHSFNHIFAGGYAAGYYSYLWAEVLSADAFSQFEQAGIFNKDTGKRLLNSILEKGGSSHPSILFKLFMGRDPEKSALLHHKGIKQ